MTELDRALAHLAHLDATCVPGTPPVPDPARYLERNLRAMVEARA